MIGIFLRLFAITFIAMAVLTWNDPSALLGLARVIERGSGRLVRELRIRAAAKADARLTYRRSLIWHRGLA